MNYQTNRLNHDFQIAYFIAGACHTPDAAYAILCDLRDNRHDAIKMFEASKLRETAKRIRANRLMASSDEADQLDAKAVLVEIDAMEETVGKNLAAANAELEMIKTCMARLEPLRKYSHLPLPEAHEAAQQEEWKLEFIFRAENFILNQGSIPSDQFAAMRLHPEFGKAILPHITKLRNLTMSDDIRPAMELVSAPKFQIPFLSTTTNTAASVSTYE